MRDNRDEGDYGKRSMKGGGCSLFRTEGRDDRSPSLRWGKMSRQFERRSARTGSIMWLMMEMMDMIYGDTDDESLCICLLFFEGL